MTEKELRRLKRSDLLEMLLEQSREVERLKEELAEAKNKLEERKIRLENAGSIAEASLSVSGVFEAAQDAAERYLESLKAINSKQEEMLAETERKCQEKNKACVERVRKMLEETERQCTERKEQLERQMVLKIRRALQECGNEEKNS